MIDVIIHDDIDLNKIVLSGQCFRAKKISNNTFLFISGNNIVVINKLSPTHYLFHCSQEEFHNFWFNYFDLSTNYFKIFNNEYGKNDFINQAMNFGRGIRILKQNPWETLISFIISQNKNIPAIQKTIEYLSRNFGKPIETEIGTVYSFPTATELLKASEGQLKESGLGYRIPYVLDAVDKVSSNKIDLAKISEQEDKELNQKLMEIKGVGPKVAACVSLFAYSRSSLVPEDVWIKKAIKENFNGRNPFKQFGKNAGLIQQYIFYYLRHSNKKKRNRESSGK